MKKIAYIVAFFLLMGCATIKGYNTASEVLYEEGPPTMIIMGGGEKDDWVYLEPLRKGILGSIPIVPNRLFPLSVAAEELCRQIRKKGIKGRVILVTGSWGGLIARRLDAMYPGMVDMIITIGSPAGGYPAIFNSIFFGVGDADSQTPLYVIAGYKDSYPRRFYMASKRNDGVFDLKAALDLGKRRISGQRVFPGHGHMDLFESQEVIQQVNSWIELERARRALMENQTR